MHDTLIDTLQNKEYGELSDNLMKVVQAKISDIITAKKIDVLNSINKVDTSDASNINNDQKDDQKDPDKSQ
jgi:hypothetical protein